MKTWHWIIILILTAGGLFAVYWFFIKPKAVQSAPANAGAASLTYSAAAGIVYASDGTEAGSINSDSKTWTDDSGNTWALTGIKKIG